jgi:Secretion system C-terminal sorting domain
MFLNFNSMKIIYSIVLFFACFLNLNAQDIFNPSAEFFATGRFRFFYGQEAIIQPPATKITNEFFSNNTFSINYELIYAYINCTQQRRSILGNLRFNLDSFVIVNGLLTKHLRMNRPTLSAPFVTFSYDDYYYSNNRTKPDSIIKFPLVMNSKSIRTFTYDVANRITTETFIEDSLGKRKNLERNIYQYNADGNLVKFNKDNFYSGKWYKYIEELNLWSGGRFIVQKAIYYLDTLPVPSDTTFSTPKYAGLSNRVDTFAQTYKDKTTGKIYPAYARFVNISQNAKGYPTKILYQVLNDITLAYEPNEEWNYTYYPGDTLVRQKIIKGPTGLIANRETYEYCGIPTLTPTTELQTLDFKIYPNPTNQVLNIEMPQNTEGPSVEIFNAMGNVVLKTKQLNVDVSALPKGIYFVQIKTKDRVGVKRFIVNR